MRRVAHAAAVVAGAAVGVLLAAPVIAADAAAGKKIYDAICADCHELKDHAGKPAADDAYILSEGQQQDEIEVTKIDEKGGLVTFNNHGEVQQLPLVVGTANDKAPVAEGQPA